MIEAVAPPAFQETDSSSYRPAMVAGFSGWLLDAFDFFLMTFCLTAIAKDFQAVSQKPGYRFNETHIAIGESPAGAINVECCERCSGSLERDADCIRKSA